MKITINQYNCFRVRAFTLIELLVVIAIIGVLASMILPSLAAAKEKGRSAKCVNNMKQLGTGAIMYADDNRDYLFYNGTKENASFPNDGQWTKNPRTGVMLDPTDDNAYWGIGYFNSIGRNKQIFRCPSSKHVDEWRDEGRNYPAEFFQCSTIGLNGSLIANNKAPKLTDFKRPQYTIFGHDAAEQKMEGDVDSIGMFPGQKQILMQWIGEGGTSGESAYYSGYNFLWEYFRHNRSCEAIMLSGSVSTFKYKNIQTGIDYRYYTGQW
jgi:prepilin-type N-terminal cleavage/methylation domain-containing protein